MLAKRNWFRQYQSFHIVIPNTKDQLSPVLTLSPLERLFKSHSLKVTEKKVALIVFGIKETVDFRYKRNQEDSSRTKQNREPTCKNRKPILIHQCQATQFEGKIGTLLLFKPIKNLWNIVKEITSFTEKQESQNLDEKWKRKVTHTTRYVTALLIKLILEIFQKQLNKHNEL